MKKAFYVVAVMLVIAGFSIAQAQTEDLGYRGLDNIWGMNPYYDFNSSGYSARTIGMGGAYYAMPNEGYSSYLNPAGMVFQTKALLSLNVLSSQDEHKGTPFVLSSDIQNPDNGYYFIDNQSTIDCKHNKLNTAGAVASFYYFGREWWVGAGFHAVYDFYNETSMPTFVEGDEALYTQDRDADAINGAIATKITDNLSFGINMNVYVRSYELYLTYPYYYYNSYLEDTSITMYQRDKSNFTGQNFDFGLLGDFDMFKAGVVFSTPYTLKQDALISYGYVDQLGDEEGYYDRITCKNKMPYTIGGGIAVTPIENLTFGADLTYKPLSKVEIDIDPEQTAYLDIDGYDPGWEDLTQYRLGLEYMFNAGFAKIPVRCGLQNMPGLLNSGNLTYSIDTTRSTDSTLVYDIDYSEGDQFNTTLFSVGTGLKLDRIWFDVAYQFGSSDFDQAIDYFGIYTSNNAIEYDYSRFYISMGMLF